MKQLVVPARQVAKRAQRVIRARVREFRTPPITGMVEEFGRAVVEGWVTVPPDAPPVRVTLSARDFDVATTPAVADRYRKGSVRRFRFLVNDLWDYLDAGDRLVVRAGNRTLPIFKVGMYVEATETGPKDFELLRKRVRAGWIFSKGGRLQRPKSTDANWQTDTFAFADEIAAELARAFSLETFTNYGALLGAVRNGGFIDHDNDLDVSYISAFRTGPEAAEEFRKVALHLVDAGYWVRCLNTHLSVRRRQGWNRWLDIFPVYFDTEGVLSFPFGVAGRSEVRIEDWKGTKRVAFGNGELTIPVNAEQMVETVYGKNWRQPDPGFAWSRDRKRRAEEGVLPDAALEEVYWANFWAHAEPEEPSTFQAWVAGRPGLPATVVDLGCGDGRDSAAFAAAGLAVLGVDRSHVAVRRAALRVPSATFEVCDFADTAAVRKVLVAAVETEGPVLFYARFLLHVLTEEVQAGLLDAIGEAARPGDVFAAEFRTTADEERPKTYERHYRRFQDGPAFGAVLCSRYGFEVLAELEADGLAPYGESEDPVLYRVLGRRA